MLTLVKHKILNILNVTGKYLLSSMSLEENIFKDKFMKIYAIYLSNSELCKVEQDLGLSL